MTRTPSSPLRLSGMWATLAAMSAGCTYNGSPIHSQLTLAEARSRVNARWTLGMSPQDVAAAAKRAGLKPERIPQAERTDGRRIEARVSRPGLRIVQLFPVPGDYCWLYFTFDEMDRLSRVEFAKPVNRGADWADIRWQVTPVSNPSESYQ